MELRERLGLIEQACQAWCVRPRAFEAAVSANAARHGYEPADVERQLLRIVAPVSVSSLEEVIARELGTVAALEGAPRELLHLVSGLVPGLLIESVLWGLVLGSRQQVRPSRDDTTFMHFLDVMPAQLRKLVHVVDEVRWERADAARVFGSDEVVDLVRSRLRAGARIAAHGSRTGIAVVDGRELAAAGAWASALAHDMGAFGGNGCMSPRVVYVVDGDADLAWQLVDPYGYRSARDATLLGVDEGAPRFAAVGRHELAATLATHAGSLQTAVLIGNGDLREHLLAAGCVRVCAPGEAHLPPFGYDPDHIGWLRPLVATSSRG